MGPPQQTTVVEQGQGASPCLGEATEQVSQASPGSPHRAPGHRGPGLLCKAEAVEEQAS